MSDKSADNGRYSSKSKFEAENATTARIFSGERYSSRRRFQDVLQEKDYDMLLNTGWRRTLKKATAFSMIFVAYYSLFIREHGIPDPNALTEVRKWHDKGMAALGITYFAKRLETPYMSNRDNNFNRVTIPEK